MSGRLLNIERQLLQNFSFASPFFAHQLRRLRQHSSNGNILYSRHNNAAWHRFETTLATIDPRKSNNPKTTGTHKKASKQRKHKRPCTSYKFVDQVRLNLSGGCGGKGCISHEYQYRSNYKKRPDGGHGGDGGFVIIVADENEQSLNMRSHHFKADDGRHGTSKQMHGKNGADKIIRVPCGVVVSRVLGFDEVWNEDEGIVQKINFEDDGNSSNDDDLLDNSINNDGSNFGDLITTAANEIDSDDNYNGKNYEFSKERGKQKKRKSLPSDYEEIVDTGIRSKDDGMYHLSVPDSIEEDLVSSNDMNTNLLEREKIVLADLDKPGSFIIAAAGGKGGVGNCAYARRQFNQNLTTKSYRRAVGVPGETAFVELELKLIADVGLVGFPNAGKSSLLAAMSMAKPEIASYPFTTLNPLVGCIEYHDAFRALVADVPGLIDGAAEGRGRGHGFLKHLERTKALLYIVDAAGTDPANDLKTLIHEISSYGDGDMMGRPALVVANKLDLIPDCNKRNEVLLSVRVTAEEAGVHFNGTVLGISAGVTGEGLETLSKEIRNVVSLEEANRITSEQ